MRLHRLTLRDVKGVRERTVELPDHGVVVIEGPNEIGKTTLLEAFDVLLSSKSSSKAADVRSLKPVDRDVAPFVEAEFTLAGQRLRYAKQWLRQPSTTLQILGPRPEQLTGDAAQQRVDSLLAEHLDRTLWDALRLTQSGDGSLVPLVSSSVLTEALDAAAGAHQHAEGADDLLAAVEAEFGAYYTPTGRPTGDYRAAMTRWTQAQDAVVEADRRRQEVASLVARHGDARLRVERAGADLDEATETLARAEEAGAAAETVAQAHAAAQQASAQAQQLHEAALRAQRHRVALARELVQAEETLTGIDRDVEAAMDQAEGMTLRVQAAETEVGAAADAVDAAEAALDAARARTQLALDVAELTRREAVVAQVTDLLAALATARAAMPDRGLTHAEARRIRSLHDRLAELLARQEASSPVLEVGRSSSPVHVETAGESPRTVGAGEESEVVLAADTVVDIPGHARLRIRLQGEAEARGARIAQVRAELLAALSAAGVHDADAADELADRDARAQAAVRDVVRDLEMVLTPHGSGLAAQAVASGAVPPKLLRSVEQAREQVGAAAATPPPTPTDPADAEGTLFPATLWGQAPTEPSDGARRPDPADLHTARQAEAAAAAAHGEARARRRTAEQGLAEVRAGISALTTRLDRAQGRRQAQAERIAELRDRLATERAETDDQALDQHVRAQAAAVAEAAQALRDAQEAVSRADVAGARARLAQARHRSSLLARARESALAELHTVAGSLEMAAGEGRDELHEQALLELEDARRSLAAVDRRARAARHLRDALLRHRDAAHRAYVRPYTQALEELGRQVYGPDFGVVVDDRLGLASRALGGVTVPFAELSGGAKEQLGILARLAVARLVDPTQGVPVVIDDALGYSDPQRLRQMGEVLASAGVAHEVQVILLTCTPDRYAAIGGAHTVRLTA